VIFFLGELAYPDTFSLRSTVLLEDTRITRSHGFRESGFQLLHVVVSGGAGKSAFKILDLDKRILGAHLLHGLSRGHSLFTSFYHVVEKSVELALRDTVVLAGVDTANVAIAFFKVLANLSLILSV